MVDGEYLIVTRAPNTAGLGTMYPAGTTINETHALKLVRLAKAHSREVP